MFIFDLDGTVIDSSHRHNTLPCGSLDLAAWKENSTFHKIMADGLLPLADFWRQQQALGSAIVVCTARVMQSADFSFLRKHGLNFAACFSRHGEHDVRRDADLKVQSLRYLPRLTDWVMFDDNDSVRDAVSQHLGIKTIHPRDFK
jgi:hypothetical protein